MALLTAMPSAHMLVTGWKLCLPFRYLGIEICSQRGMQVPPGVIWSAGLKAVWGLASQLRDRDVCSIGLRVQLFDSIVMPVQYGFKVWSTPLIQNPAKSMVNSV